VGIVDRQRAHGSTELLSAPPYVRKPLYLYRPAPCSHTRLNVESDWPAWPSDDDRAVNGLLDGHLEATPTAASGPLSWNSVKSTDARQQWSALREWVEWFRLTFAFDYRVVRPCWYRHPAFVEVLSALPDHWVCAYGPLNPAVGASDWHRALMQLEPRLRGLGRAHRLHRERAPPGRRGQIPG
jgi:hypothetical protein